MKVKSILISQPKPKANSPYTSLSASKVKVDFRPFIQVEPVNSRLLREQKIKVSDFTAIILTSRNSIDNFFRIAEEIKYKVPDSLKYFCTSEAVATYLQKYIVYRKRKIFIGTKNIFDLEKQLKSNQKEKFFLPSSDILNTKVSDFLDNLGIEWVRGVLYKTICSDLSDLKNVSYDILVFFSPQGIESLFKNFPDFKQNETKIAVFGNSTINAASLAGLEVDIKAPTKETPSMVMALKKFIEQNKKA